MVLDFPMPGRREAMKKRMPTEEEIRKGIIGKSMAGVKYRGFISKVRGKYYTGYEVIKGSDFNDGKEEWKPGQLVDIERARSLKSALAKMIHGV